MVVRKTYKPGDYLVICDRTGMTRYRSECRYEWNGLLVWEKAWEPRHPQDFVQGVADDQSVPDARPDIPSTIGQTTVKVTGAFGDTTIDLTSITGIAGGDGINIVLDDGTIHATFSDGTPAGDTVTLGSYLPGAATALNVVYLPGITSHTEATYITGDDL